MKNDCLFCAIIDGEIPSNKVYEDEQCYAFYDIDPQAPTHFLVVPKEHTSAARRRSTETTAVWWPTASRSSPRSVEIWAWIATVSSITAAIRPAKP